MIPDDDLTPEELRAKYYRWWTVKAWCTGWDWAGVKMGPVTISWYRWFDERLRVSVTTAWTRSEWIIFGGPLA